MQVLVLMLMLMMKPGLVAGSSRGAAGSTLVGNQTARETDQGLELGGTANNRNCGWVDILVHVGSRPKERGWEWKYVPRVVDLEVWKGEVVTSERGFATLASFKTCGLVASKEGPPTSTKTQGKAGTD